MVGFNNFVEHYSGTFSTSHCVAHFEHDRDKLQVWFRASGRIYSAEISYNSIAKILIVSEAAGVNLYLVLSHPVMLYGVEQGKVKDLNSVENSKLEIGDDTENELNTRNDIPVNDDEVVRIDQLTDIDARTPWIRALEFEHKEKKCQASVIGMSTTFKLLLKFSYKQDVWEAVIRLIHNCENTPAFFTPMKTHQPVRDVNLQFSSEYFDCRYALECVLSRSREVKDQLGLRNERKVVVDNLKNFAKQDEASRKALERALLEIQIAMDNGNVVIFSNALQVLYKRYCGSDPPYLPEDMILVKRAVITPTRIMYLPPLQYKSNRLLKTCDSRYALKVVVKDDNLDKLCFTLRGSTDGKKALVKDLLKDKLMKGIKIGKMQYRILGCSSSQLRNGGLWLYAEDEKERTAEDIRKKLGEFSKIKQVSKYLARVGMFLSQAQKGITIPKECTVVEEDITGGVQANGKPYIFSDGIGRMSKAIAEKVYKAMKIEDWCPSAVQIRYAGCKGMLVVDPTLEGEKIIFRESMKKVESDHTSLEILKLSAPRAVRLNRPLITILDQMHPSSRSKNYIFRLLSEDLNTLAKALIYEDDAAKLLRQNQLRALSDGSPYSNLSLPFSKLRDIGIPLTAEPFFRSMLHAIVRKSVEHLRKKTRVPIPFSLGRNALGVLDETGTLEYGQVFFQYSLEEHAKWNGPAKVLTGNVLVTKNPCMHPGDVRKFKAIDVEGLHHIRDCIVFPKKGKRPHPDEMAGSDLDGDEYVVIWDQALIFEANAEPMDFPCPDEKQEDEGVKEEDIVDFFCDYILEDNIGTIANAHLAWADKLYRREERWRSSSKGIFAKKLMTLAKKYSVNLDLAKRGGIPERLTKGERVFKYPDFMEKYEVNDSYMSTNLLGKMYHLCILFEMCILENEVVIKHLPDPTLCCLGWETYEQDALSALEDYEKKISDLMSTYHIDSEAELITGCYLNITKYLRDRDESWNLQELLGMQVKAIFESMQQRFLTTLKSKKIEEDDEEKRKLASAWYMIQYSRQSKFFGLPWTVSKVICELKFVNEADRPAALAQSPLFTFIGSLIPTPSEDQYNKTQELNVAWEILQNWLSSQDNYSQEEMGTLKDFVQNKFSNVLTFLCKDGSLEALRGHKGLVGRIIVDTLQKMSEECLRRAPKDDEISNDDSEKEDREELEYEVSLAALMTLGRLATQRDAGILGIGSGDVVSLKTGAKTRTIRFRVSLREKDFGLWAVRNLDVFKKSLQMMTDVEELGIEPKQFKRPKTDEEKEWEMNGIKPVKDDDNGESSNGRHKRKHASNGRGRMDGNGRCGEQKRKEVKGNPLVIDWYFLVTARGHMWALQQLRKFALTETFQQQVMECGKTLLEEQENSLS